jgi:hypothetical protein
MKALSGGQGDLALVTDAYDSPSTVTVTFTITVLHGHPRP